MLTLRICIRVFSGRIKARILKLGIHMNNELLKFGIDNRTHCFCTSAYLSVFSVFLGFICVTFSKELFKLESSNMENIH